MARRVYFLDLVDEPAAIAEYERLHRDVWPEVLAHFRATGIRACRIDRCGNRLVMTVEGVSGARTDAGELPPRIVQWEQLVEKFQVRVPAAQEGEKWVLGTTIFDWTDDA